MPTPTLIDAKNEFHQVLRNLMHLYLYDFSEMTGDDTDENGMFTDEHLEKYWVEPTRYPFLIVVDGKYAGFVLVREMVERNEPETTYSIAEFFVMRKYRRMKIGQQAARMVFDRFRGRWHVAEISENTAAQLFWRKVIAEYTQNQYEEAREPNWDGPVQVFSSRG